MCKKRTCLDYAYAPPLTSALYVKNDMEFQHMNKHLYNYSNILGLLLFVTTSAFCYPSYAELYKCKDKDNNITYSDKGCMKTKNQELDLVISPVDDATYQRLKNRTNGNNNQEFHRFSIPNRVNKYNNKQVAVIKTKKTSMECKSYTNIINNQKNRLRSGYNATQGKSIQRTISNYSKLYDKNCN